MTQTAEKSGIIAQASADQARAINPKASIWVGASAGTGKTKVLTDRVLALMLTGTAPQKILCLTFTKAAAAEMSNRLADRLAKWTIAPDAALKSELEPLLGAEATDDHARTARQLFAKVLDTPGGMRIETIHGFCQSLLRRFPIEAGLPPHFQVMDERDAQESLSDAREAILAQARADTDPRLAKALSAITSRVHESTFDDLMKDLTKQRSKLARLFSRHGDLNGLEAALRQHLGLSQNDDLATLTAAVMEDGAFDGPGLKRAMAALLQGSVKDRELGDAVDTWLANPQGRAEILETHIAAFLTVSDCTIRKTLGTKPTLARDPGIADILQTEAERLLAFVHTRGALDALGATLALLTLAKALLDAYGRTKANRAVLDFDDLILAARALLERDGISPWVLYKLDGGIDHVLIDEAQDTSPDQWAVVTALTAEFFSGQSAREVCRTIFVVGDAKQSIYSFQGADPNAFAAMREHFATQVTGIGGTWADVPLSVSFRSSGPVIDAVNALFAPGSPVRPGVDPTEDHLPARQGQAGRVVLWPPVIPRGDSPSEPWKPPIERIKGDSPHTRLAGLIAQRIKAMVGIEDLPSRGRPIRAGDILVLVRRRTGFVTDLIRALKALDVPVAGADRMKLTEQIAVMDLMALGRCLCLPQDDLTLAVVLKSPLIGLDEDQLFHLARLRSGTLWESLRARMAEAPAFERAHQILTDWANLSDRSGPFALFSAVLGRDGARAAMAARLGPEAGDPLDEFLALALTYEARHPPSLAGFLHWLDSADIEIKRDLDQGGADAVRIMTVHGSKGLQAPIVFLPDTMGKPSGQKEQLRLLGTGEDAVLAWAPTPPFLAKALACDAAKAARSEARLREYHRLLYVAATRAEDQLIVCGWKGRNTVNGSWYDGLRDGLAPLAALREDAFLAAAGETESAQVLDWTSLQTAPPDRVKDSLWDDADGAAQPLPAWARVMPPAEPAPPRPLAPSRPEGDEPVPLSPVERHAATQGYRRGRIIHRLLQVLPEVDATQWESAIARHLQQTAADWDDAARRALTAEVIGVLEHPHFHALFGPDSLAEVPVAGLIGGRALAGVVDRLVIGPTDVLIADFKTNRSPPASGEAPPPAYVAQLALYRQALTHIYPTHRIRCALIWTSEPRLDEVPAALMDAALG